MIAKTLRLLTLLVATFLISIPSIASAELGSPMPAPMPQVSPEVNKGPSVEETLKWIKEKIEDESNFTNFARSEGSVSYATGKEFELSGCKITYYELTYPPPEYMETSKSNEEIRRNFAPMYLTSQAFSLSDIDPATIWTMNGHLYLNTVGKANKVLPFIMFANRNTGDSESELLSRGHDLRFLYGRTRRGSDIHDGWVTDYKLNNPKTNAAYQSMREEAWIDRVFDKHVKKELGTDGYKPDQVRIYFEDKDDTMANRLATAFKHAIGLCQQQLKEAPPPKKKELF